jgi:hypothetical protein
VFRILTRKSEGKRSRGRRMLICESRANVKMYCEGTRCEDVNCNNLPEERDQWMGLVKATMKSQVKKRQ